MATSASSYANIAQGMGSSSGAFSPALSGRSVDGVSPKVASTYDCAAGGSITYDSTVGVSGTSFSMDFNQCTYSMGLDGSSLIMNGTQSGTWSGSYDWNISMPSFSFTVTGNQSVDMTFTNYSVTATSTATGYTLDYGMTLDVSTLDGAFTIETTTPLVYPNTYSLYPTSGVVEFSANGTATITYYDGGYTVTYSGGTIDCAGYICPM
ncbi:MAG: hypothetical protein HUJ29_02635 [Gammaproteobacteria bacterium]|nr:hypothetical protein [Gammaproteobacteria bacterium]